jgi:hypothetical protein
MCENRVESCEHYAGNGLRGGLSCRMNGIGVGGLGQAR